MGKTSAPPPDYTPLMELGREGLSTMRDLSGQQLSFARQQYADLLPLAQQVSRSQIETQGELRDQARQYFAAQQGLMKEAQEFSTPGYREQLAADAAASAARAFGTTQAATARAQAARGVNPASGAGLAMQQQNMLGLAAQRAGAMTATRQQADAYGRQLQYSALGLSAPALGAYQAASGAGSAGLASAAAPGAGYMQGMGQAAGTMGQGFQFAGGALGNVLGAQTQYAQAAMSQEDPFASIIGTGLGVWARSDRRLKQNIEKVGVHKETGLPLYDFEYVDHPGARFRGVMADDVEAKYPKAVFTMPDGFKSVNYRALGITLMRV